MDNKKSAANLPQILDMLSQALELEYSLIVHYPRIASSIPDEETRKLVHQLGSDSIGHADAVANTITKLGGVPHWSFGPFPEETDIVKTFEVQLEKEKLALQLHRRIAGLILDSSLRDRFNEFAKKEEQHIRIVEQILSRVGQ